MNQIIQENLEENEEKLENERNHTETKEKNVLKKILIAFLIIIIIGIGSVGTLLYGPYDGFRNWLVTTAMTTMTHQWIAYVFYSENTVNTILENNKVEEINEETDVNAIVVGVKSNENNYKNEYERQILEKENKDDTYKIIEISGKGYSGYLAVIYNPANVHTLVTAKMGKSGQYLTTMAKDNKAVVAINGGGFDDPGYNSNGANPLGVTYSNGNLLTSYYYAGAGGIIGFDTNDKLVLSSTCTAEAAELYKIRDCVTCGPFLIVNGKASTVVGNGGWGTAPRTAIGQRQDGIVLFLVIDRKNGIKAGC